MRVLLYLPILKQVALTVTPTLAPVLGISASAVLELFREKNLKDDEFQVQAAALIVHNRKYKYNSWANAEVFISRFFRFVSQTKARSRGYVSGGSQ